MSNDKILILKVTLDENKGGELKELVLQHFSEGGGLIETCT